MKIVLDLEFTRRREPLHLHEPLLEEPIQMLQIPIGTAVLITTSPR